MKGFKWTNWTKAVNQVDCDYTTTPIGNNISISIPNSHIKLEKPPKKVNKKDSLPSLNRTENEEHSSLQERME